MYDRAEWQRREIPFDSFPWWPDQTRPDTALAALMQCAPHEDPRVSSEELLELRETIALAFKTLTPEEVWVFNALVIERLSLRQLGKQINAPKTTIARIRDRATRKLRAALIDNPAIIDFQNRDSNG
jgi:hypothetical protein